MISPEHLNEALEANTHAEQAEFEMTGGPGVKQFNHLLEFSEYRTLPLLQQQVDKVEDEEGVDLIIETIKPVIHMSESAVESRLRVTVKETANRYEEENRSLEDYEITE